MSCMLDDQASLASRFVIRTILRNRLGQNHGLPEISRGVVMLSKLVS